MHAFEVSFQQPRNESWACLMPSLKSIAVSLYCNRVFKNFIVQRLKASACGRGQKLVSHFVSSGAGRRSEALNSYKKAMLCKVSLFQLFIYLSKSRTNGTNKCVFGANQGINFFVHIIHVSNKSDHFGKLVTCKNA